MSNEIAILLVNQGRVILKEIKREKGRKQISSGLLLLAIGAVITFISYTMASAGGSYLVMTGALVWGGWTIIKGIFNSM